MLCTYIYMLTWSVIFLWLKVRTVFCLYPISESEFHFSNFHAGRNEEYIILYRECALRVLRLLIMALLLVLCCDARCCSVVSLCNDGTTILPSVHCVVDETCTFCTVQSIEGVICMYVIYVSIVQ